MGPEPRGGRVAGGEADEGQQALGEERPREAAERDVAQLALEEASAAAAAALRRVRLYHQNIIDHYESPRNVGTLDKEDPNVGTGLVGAPACGDVMRLQMRFGEDGRVEEAVFKARARALPPPPSVECARFPRRP